MGFICSYIFILFQNADSNWSTAADAQHKLISQLGQKYNHERNDVAVNMSGIATVAAVKKNVKYETQAKRN